MPNRLPRPKVGERFGKLRVVIPEGRKNGKRAILCVCDCGELTAPNLYNLKNGRTRSCGCISHGMRNVPEYSVWSSIIQRCTNPKNHSWGNYGGAGVTVCDRWLHSFQAFYEDMGPRPAPDYEIDKDLTVQGNKVYGPDACRWIQKSEHRSETHKGRRKNKSGVRMAVIDGVEMTCTEIARKYGLSKQTVCFRMKAGRTGADLIAPPDRGIRVTARME